MGLAERCEDCDRKTQNALDEAHDRIHELEQQLADAESERDDWRERFTAIAPIAEKAGVCV